MQIRIPAICTSCGKISYNVTLDSNADLEKINGSYTCPFCKTGKAVLRIDIYKIINNLVDELKVATPERLVEIKGLLNQYNSVTISNLNFNIVASEITEKAPELKSLKDLVPRTRMEAYTVIGMAITLVLAVTTLLLTGKPVNNNEVINNSFPPTVFKTPYKPQLKPKTTSLTTISTVSRNEKCPCGSGKKYKNCHGSGR